MTEVTVDQKGFALFMGMGDVAYQAIVNMNRYVMGLDIALTIIVTDDGFAVTYQGDYYETPHDEVYLVKLSEDPSFFLDWLEQQVSAETAAGKQADEDEAASDGKSIADMAASLMARQ